MSLSDQKINLCYYFQSVLFLAVIEPQPEWIETKKQEKIEKKKYWNQW